MKIFDRHDSEIGRVTRINEDLWFRIMQPQLLQLANTDYGKDLLCIPKSYKRIFKIGKNHIFHSPRQENGQWKYDWDFRIGAKWANVIRSRWSEFQGALMWQEANGLILPRVRERMLMSAAFGGPYYPAAGQANGADGPTGNTTLDQAFATKRAAAGNDSNAFAASEFSPRLTAHGVNSGNYNNMYRSVTQFDTSAIPDTDTINTATYSIVASSKNNALSQSVEVAQCSPGATTDVVNSDFNIANWTMTLQSDTSTTLAAFTADGTTYNDFALNATGIGNISKTGTTKFGTVLSSDRQNSAPTWSAGADAYINMIFADTAGTSTDPKLTGTSTTTTSGGGSLALLLGVG